MRKSELSKLERLINRAEEAYLKQSLAVEAVENMLNFVGFEETGTTYLPNLSIASGGEMILVYDNSELHRQDIIELMATKGHIEPSDFLT